MSGAEHACGRVAVTFLNRAILFGGTILWMGFVALRPPNDVPRRIQAYADLLVGVATGFVVLSTLVVLLQRRLPGHRADPVAAAAWSITRGLLATFVAWLVAGVVTGGFGDTPEMRILLLLLGLAGGIGHGWWTASRPRTPEFPSNPIDDAGECRLPTGPPSHSHGGSSVTSRATAE